MILLAPIAALALSLSPSATAAREPSHDSALAAAREKLTQVKQDPKKRKFRHHWEKAILALVKAAKGRDEGPALCEAARGRLELFKFSRQRTDLEDAAALGQRAARAGCADGAALAARAKGLEGPVPRAMAKLVELPRAIPKPSADDIDQEDEDDPNLAFAQASPPPPPLKLDPTGPSIPSDAERAKLIAELGLKLARRQAFSAGEAVKAPEVGEVAIAGEDEERPLGSVRRVVIDAGHGGHDTGAIGPSKIREKDVVLRIARKLAARLEKAGYEVVLTRDADEFRKLGERTALANGDKADLFVSVHANAHTRRSTRGVETYFLDVENDRYAARLTARESGAGEVASEGEAARILTDLNAQSSARASRRLAELVQKEICGGLRRRLGDVKDLGVKSALFYVLLGARMPAVLVEAGFVSNKAEEKRLASDGYQDEVAAGIARAITSYARERAPVAAR